MKNISKLLALLILVLYTADDTLAQDSREYSYTTDKNGHLYKDANGNTINFSSVTSVVAENSLTVNSAAHSLPFNVVFMGKVYKHFMIGSAGYFLLGNTDDPSQPFSFSPANDNTFKQGNNTNRFQGFIAPFWDYTNIVAKSLKHTTTGTAPNRAFVVEWTGYIGNVAPKAGNESFFQARIYETTGVVEMVYGRMQVPAGNAFVTGATIGISKNSALNDYNFWAIADLDSFTAVNTLAGYSAAADKLYNTADSGDIDPLDYDNDSVARRFVFTPGSVNAPGNLQAFNITADSALIYWDDNSSNEIAFELFIQNKQGDYVLLDTTTAGFNFYNLRGLFPGETYRLRVRTYAQGKYSAFSNTLVFNTPAAQLVKTQKSGLWTDTATWAGGFLPTRYDSVVISNGDTVTLNDNNANAFHLTIDSGRLVYQDIATQARKLTVYGNVWIAKNGTITAPTMPLNTNTNTILTVRGDLYNQGTLNLFEKDTTTKIAGTRLSFFGTNVSYFTSDSGTITDLNVLAIERINITDSVYLRPYSLTVRNGNTDATSGAGFVDGNVWAGTLAIDRNFKVHNRFFTTATISTGTKAGLWLNNDSLEIVSQNGNIAFNGNLKISKGLVNLTNNAGNIVNGAMSFTLEGGEVNIGGRYYSSTGIAYIQNGGKLRVAVVGNNTTDPSFGISTSANVQMLGGEIIIARPGTSVSTARLDYFTGTGVSSTINNTWLRLGEYTGQTGKREFILSGNVPNMQVDSAQSSADTVKVKISTSLRAYGKFNLSVNDSFNLNSGTLYLHDSTESNGLVYTSTAAGMIVIAGNKTAINGQGYINIPRLEVFQPDTASTFALAKDSLLQTISLNLTQGKFINTKYLRLGDSVKNIMVEVGRTGTRYNGVVLDSFPTLYKGAGTYALTYTNLGKTYITSYEIPADRIIHALTVNSDSAIKINNGRLDVLQTVTLAKGVVITDSTNRLRLVNPTAAAMSAGSATAYVKGPLTRRISANLTGATTYTLPTGDNAYSPLILNNIFTDTTTVELTAEYNSEPLNYTAGNGITSLDSTFGYWTVKADSNVKSLTKLGVNVTYKIADGFVRLAAGKASTVTASPVVVDSVGTKLSALSTTLAGSNITLDSAKPVLFIAAGEFLGDTLYSKTYKVGAGQDFENLTAISKKLSTSYLAGDLTFLITPSYVDDNEQYPIFFNQLRYAAGSKKVLVRLDSGAMGIVTSTRTKTQNPAYGMIAFYGGDSIEFDGSGYDIAGNPTNTREWTFRAEVNVTNASVFMLQQDARYITLNNLNIIANSTIANNGGVVIGSTFAGGQGNDFFTLKNSVLNIGDKIASCGVVSVGLSAAAANDSIEITNNEFANFGVTHLTASTNSGAGWKISGNHFYQNDARIATLYAKAIEILAEATASGYEISYNYFGGSQKFAAGTAWTTSNATQNQLITLGVKYEPASVFKGNVIKNIAITATTSFVVRPVAITRGKWLISGNKFGGTSAADALNYSNSNAFSFIFVPNTTLTAAEITDNDFSFINRPGTVTTLKISKIIDYTAPEAALIARNTIHDIQSVSSRATAMQEGAITGIFINNGVNGNIIENNEIYNISNNSGTAAAWFSAIGISNGGGEIRNNKIYNLNYTTTSATVGNIAGMHVQGLQWNIYNNQVTLYNQAMANAALSMQGIRYYSTVAAPGNVSNNSIRIGGQTRNTNSYGLVHGNASVRVAFYNNIVININNMTGGPTFRAVGMHAAPGANLSSDFNLFYVPKDSNTFFNLNNSQVYHPNSWTTSFGHEKNSQFQFSPVFKDTINNLLLTGDTINWKLNAAGRAAGVTSDYETDSRNSTQPDIGVDEFAAPMFTQPVFLGGNDTLCAGNGRTLKVQNPNTGGKIYWFNQPYGGDTLAIGDSILPTVNTDTIYYAQVSDSLMRSYRIAVPVKTKPVFSPAITTLPTDSICYGTSVNLVADSAAGVTVKWYDSLNAPTPFYTGASYKTPALTADSTFFIQTEYNGCLSAKTPVSLRVSSVQANILAINDTIICEGGNVVFASGTDTLRWYTGWSTDLGELAEDTLFDAGAISADTSFYYEVYKGTCVGERKQVDITVNPYPAKPVIDSLFTICNNAGITLTATAPGTINWYADTTQTSVDTGAFIFTTLTADSTLYLDNTLNGCTSEKIKTTVKVLSPVMPALVSATTPICFNTTSELVVSKTGNGTVKWYDATGLVTTGDTLKTTALTADKTYYYELFDGLCTSTRDSVTIFVNAFAAKPGIGSIDSICYGETDTINVTATGGTIDWYETKTSAVFFTGNDFITPPVTGTKKYFVKAIYSGCESGFEEVSIPVRALPQPPVVDSVSQVCRGNATVLKSVSPVTTEWYNSTFATTPVFTGSNFATQNLTVNTTFYVQAFDGKCRSERRPVSVSLRNAPAAPVINNTDPFCWGDMVNISAGSNSVVRWYKTAADTVPFRSDSALFVGNLFKDTTYYIESYDGFCTSSKVTYNVGVIRYMDGFSFTVPDSANIHTPTVLTSTGNFDNLYSWNFGSGASISSATGTGPHTIDWNSKGQKNIRLVVSKKVGNVTCDTVITKTLKVYNLSELLSVAYADKSSFISVYPNPASSALNIATVGEENIQAVALIDITGKQVYIQNVQDSRHTVVVDGFAKGLYLLHITLDNGQTAIQKVIID